MELQANYLGQISYAEGRTAQAAAREMVVRDLSPGVVLYCEHPPTITLGRRVSDADEKSLRAKFAGELEVVRTSRGGHATYHGPGQLVIYPAIDLRRYGIGVRRFVELCLSVLGDLLSDEGFQARLRLDQPGVWVRNADGAERKVAAVGFHIAGGVTDHGLALNVCCDLGPFERFNPCGMAPGLVTSLAASGGTDGGLPDLAAGFHARLSGRFPALQKVSKLTETGVGTCSVLEQQRSA